MLKILLIRPGETEYDQQGRIQGTLDVPLSEDGRRQVEAVIAELRAQPVEAIYCSPCQAATETAESLATAADLRARPLDDLHNLDHGLWQGMLIDDVKTKQPKVYRQWQEQPFTVCPPQGEAVLAAKARVAGVLLKLLKKHKRDTMVALIVAEPLATVVRHVLRHDALGDLWQSRRAPAGWEVLEVEPTAVQAG